MNIAGLTLIFLTLLSVISWFWVNNYQGKLPLKIPLDPKSFQEGLKLFFTFLGYILIIAVSSIATIGVIVYFFGEKEINIKVKVNILNPLPWILLLLVSAIIYLIIQGIIYLLGFLLASCFWVGLIFLGIIIGLLIVLIEILI